MTVDEISRLTPDERALVDEVFGLTQEEHSRLDVARSTFGGSLDTTIWGIVAANVHEVLLASYADGELDLRGAMERARRVALPCILMDRVWLEAAFLERALQITPPMGRRPVSEDQNPSWIKHAGAILFGMFLSESPGKPFSPNAMNGRTTALLNKTIDWLVALGVTNPIEPATLYGWWRDHIGWWRERDRAADMNSIVEGMKHARATHRLSKKRFHKRKRSRKLSPKRPSVKA